MTGSCPINLGFCPKEFYLSYKGRITRKDFWLKFFLPLLAIAILIGAVEGVNSTAIGTVDETSVEGSESSIIFNIFTILILWPSIVISAKRLHDRNKSGWGN